MDSNPPPHDSKEALPLENVLNRGYRYALSLTHNRDEAWDLIQSAYLKVHHLNTSLTIPYLFRVIKNLHIDHFRKKRVRFNWFSKQTLPPPNSISEPPTIDPLLDKVLKKLKPIHREILFLSSVECYTAQEIGSFLNMPRNSVLSILHRAKQKLRKQLATDKVGAP